MGEVNKVGFSLLKMGSSRRVKRSLASDAHGGTVLLGGDETNGFYGEILVEDFLTSQQISDLCNFHEGVLDTSTHFSWLKFVINGKILLLPKAGRIRSSVSWDQIYQAGMVYGDDTYGTYPSGSPVLQNKRVTVDGVTYKVRMLSGSPGEPMVNHISGGDNKYQDLKDTEYGKLFFPIISRQFADEEKWWNYNETEIGFGSGSHGWYYVKESYSADGVFIRPLGYWSPDYVHTSSYRKTVSYVTFIWTPVLELET